MSGESNTLARPYAEAVFARAQESGQLDQWSGTLALLSQVVRDPAIAEVLSNPAVDQGERVRLLLEIGGDQFSAEAQNLVRVLVENQRLSVVPEIHSLFLEMKNAHEGVQEVEVVSAYPLEPELESELATALKRKLGREIQINSRQDPDLIGGVKIRAGDMVIDGSIAGQLARLTNELGI